MFSIIYIAKSVLWVEWKWLRRFRVAQSLIEKYLYIENAIPFLSMIPVTEEKVVLSILSRGIFIAGIVKTSVWRNIATVLVVAWRHMHLLS